MWAAQIRLDGLKKKRETRSRVVWKEEVGLGGGEYDQKTLYKILKGLINKKKNLIYLEF